MSLQRYARDTPNVAIFAKNHLMYLEGAAAREPDQLTTFRSSATWRSAHTAVDHHGPRTIYFMSIGDDEGLVTHQAVLEEVLILKEWDQEEIDQTLLHQLPETEKEGLWDGNVQTLYVIRNCREFEEPFPFTELTKLEDGIGLSEGFRYSYALVIEREESSVE